LNGIKLSICIPTYNRCNYLSQAIESIVECLTDELREIVEIVVSDNASTDDTEKVVCGYKKDIKNLVYSKSPYNCGFDRNLIKVIDLASGEYCWILGDDDEVCKDSISSILNDIKNSQHDILLYERLETDASFEKEPVYSPWTSLPEGLTFNLGSEISSFYNYLDKCNSLGGMFSYISVLVFKKAKWDCIPVKDRMAHTGYTHVYMLFSMMADNANVRYAKKPIVICRLGNDSICPVMTWDNIYRRLKFDIDGYREIVLCVFDTDSILSRVLLKQLEKLIPMDALIGIRVHLKTVTGPRHPLDILLLNSGYIRTYVTLHLKVFKTRFKKLLKFKRTKRHNH